MHLDTFIQTDFQVGKVPLDGPFGNRTQVDQYLFLSPDFLFVCYIYIYIIFLKHPTSFELHMKPTRSVIHQLNAQPVIKKPW